MTATTDATLPGMPADVPPGDDAKAAAAASDGASAGAPKRGRGRPRKARPDAAPAAPAKAGRKSKDDILRERLGDLYAGLAGMLVLASPGDAEIMLQES